MTTQYYASNLGTGDGTSVEQAADLFDLVATINNGIDDDLIVNILDDIVCDAGWSMTDDYIFQVTEHPSPSYPVIWRGRNADSTADHQRQIDANGIAKTVFRLEGGNHIFKRIDVSNVGDPLPALNNNDCWEAPSAARNYFLKCGANGGTKGFQSGGVAVECLASNCFGDGFDIDYAYGCTSKANSGPGFDCRVAVRCLSINNGSNGVLVTRMAVECTAHGNSGGGFVMPASQGPMLVVRCIATSNIPFGYFVSGANGIIVDSADFLNSISRTFTTSYIEDINPITLTALPYEDEGSDNYDLNDNAAGGVLCNNTDGTKFGVDGILSYVDCGAAQSPGG